MRQKKTSLLKDDSQMMQEFDYIGAQSDTQAVFDRTVSMFPVFPEAMAIRWGKHLRQIGACDRVQQACIGFRYLFTQRSCVGCLSRPCCTNA